MALTDDHNCDLIILLGDKASLVLASHRPAMKHMYWKTPSDLGPPGHSLGNSFAPPDVDNWGNTCEE